MDPGAAALRRAAVVPADVRYAWAMRVEDLQYDLPSELIAERPAARRADARLLVVRVPGSEPGPGEAGGDPLAGVALEHRVVRELPDLLAGGDLLVMNDTRVLPARFDAVRSGTEGRIEGLFLETRDDEHWLVMLKSGGRLRGGDEVVLIDRGGRRAADSEGEPLALKLLEPAGDGAWWARRHGGGEMDTQAVLDRIGAMPLPPYIRRQREQQGIDPEALEALDRDRYQTVYARQPGAVAAPTAGLHLTPELLQQLRERGVGEAFLTLHVGLGTFQPVRTGTLEEHPMHVERYAVPSETLGQLRAARRRDGRIIPVGTTSVRALESLPDPLPSAEAGLRGETDLKILPGFRFRFCDGLLTNFHLPGSTLMALVGARLAAPDDPSLGVARLKAVYREAIAARYRFYSYGDAMLILPQ